MSYMMVHIFVLEGSKILASCSFYGRELNYITNRSSDLFWGSIQYLANSDKYRPYPNYGEDGEFKIFDMAKIKPMLYIRSKQMTHNQSDLFCGCIQYLASSPKYRNPKTHNSGWQIKLQRYWPVIYGNKIDLKNMTIQYRKF